MEERKKKILLIVGAILVLAIAVAVYLFYFYDSTPKKQDTNDNSTPNNQTNLPENQDGPESQGTTEPVETSPRDYDFRDKEELGENDLKKMAGSFAERFGSYSSHSSYGNIEDLRVFMSENMRQWAENYIKEQVEQESQNNDYYGISTRAIVTKVREFNKDRGRATVIVETQRTEKKGDQENVFNQSMQIKFVKEGDEWKVNRAEWQ